MTLGRTNITIVISSFNQSDSVIASINKLVQQSANRSDVSIVVADDGSEPEQIRKICSAIQALDWAGDIFLVWQQNRGFRLAKSRNNGLALASAGIVIFLDGDCIPTEDFLSAYAEAHSRFGSVSLITGHRKFILPSEALEGKRDTLEAIISRKEREEAYDIDTRSKSEAPWSSILGRNFSCTMTKGGPRFDERLKGWGFEDIEFAIKYFLAYQASFHYCANAVVNQVDDFSETHNPFITKSDADIINAILNGITVIATYRKYENIFCTLANLLAHYVIPFRYSAGHFTYNPVEADIFFRNAALGKSYTLSEADRIYSVAREIAIDFVTRQESVAQQALRARLANFDSVREIRKRAIAHVSLSSHGLNSLPMMKSESAVFAFAMDDYVWITEHSKIRDIINPVSEGQEMLFLFSKRDKDSSDLMLLAGRLVV